MDFLRNLHCVRLSVKTRSRFHFNFFFTLLKVNTCEQISMHFLQNEADLGRRQHLKKLIILYHQSSFYKQPLRHRGSNIGYSLYLQRVLICRYFTTGIFIIQRIALFLLCFLPKNIIISLIFFFLHFVDYSRTMTGRFLYNLFFEKKKQSFTLLLSARTNALLRYSKFK